MLSQLDIMTSFGEQVESKALLNTTRTTAPLLGIASSNVYVDKTRQLPLLVISCISTTSNLSTHLISFCLPVSITQVISGIVTPVSAMFVARR
jgi:hypothetical protein